jgi:transaldolase
MEWLLDSADAKDWKRVSITGLFSAVTTNPLLIQRAGLNCSLNTYKALHDQAMDLGFDHLQLQVFGEHWEAMAEQILSISDKTIVKIPANEKGFALASKLALPKRTTITGVYSVHLGSAAERLGVAYAAPYYARLAESNRDVEEIFAGLRAACQNTKILVASLRSIEQFEHLIASGHRCFTIPGTLLDDLMTDEMTEAAVVQFEEAAKA